MELAINRSDGAAFGEKALLDEQDKDVFTTAHSPQRAILDHPHALFFIFHARNSLVDETLYPDPSNFSLSDQLSTCAGLVHSGM